MEGRAFAYHALLGLADHARLGLWAYSSVGGVQGTRATGQFPVGESSRNHARRIILGASGPEIRNPEATQEIFCQAGRQRNTMNTFRFD
jgi:hypothetical protein